MALRRIDTGLYVLCTGGIVGLKCNAMRVSLWPSSSEAHAFAARRARVTRSLHTPALLACGLPRPRNYPANTYPFRAESHFLYLVGRPLQGAALLLDRTDATLFVMPPDPERALWEGPEPGLDVLENALGLRVFPLSELDARLAPIRQDVATLPPNDERTADWLSGLLNRPVVARSGARLISDSADARFADAMIAARLVQDTAAVSQLRQAAAVTAGAHEAGMKATRPGVREASVGAAMVAAISGSGMDLAYAPIVTVHGEILHNEAQTSLLTNGDLVLADVGAETPEGWAADVTRTWPVSGRFSTSQRELYDVVLEAQLAALGVVHPGVEYRDVHTTAARTLLNGMIRLGIFHGDVESLFERGAHTLFFMHGVGHLLGLDVHDMEDLGDRAGYAPGRKRRTRFGDAYLRLDRPLVAGMAITIEPGWYQVPALLNDPARSGPFADVLDRRRLEAFADVRGIRIEDDVLVTDGGCEVLTASIAKTAEAIEAAVLG